MRPWPSASLLATAILLLAAGPAAADCEPAGAPQEALANAPVAFVGTVTAVDGPRARFEVLEVWAGPVGRQVEVRGTLDEGADGLVAVAEDDRAFTPGATYLVLPWVDGDDLRESICTATVEWSDELAALRPADAVIHGPGAAAPAESGSIPGPVLAAVAAAAVVATVSMLAFRRRGEQSR